MPHDPVLVADAKASLTEYAWCFRYPGEPDEPSKKEAEQALAVAREAHDAILALRPEEVRPSQ